MKKYLLFLLIVPLLFVGGFSSAFDLDIEFTCNKFSCYQQHNYSFDYNVSQAIPKGDYYIIDSNIPINNFSYSINYEYGINDEGFGNPINVSKEFLYLPPTANPYISFTFDLGEDLKSGDKLKFKLVDSSYNPPLVPGGTANFTPIITGLTGSINEFIPYLVHIGLGVLGVLISFVSIKRLINWIRAKIFSSFK